MRPKSSSTIFRTAVYEGGLAVATLLTLVFLPALYVTWFRIKSPDHDAGPRMDLAVFEPIEKSEPVRHDALLEDA